MVLLAPPPAPTVQHLEMRGPHAELFETTEDALVEGPLGTGKSFGGLYWIRWAAETYPGTRWFLSRKKRVDMTQSTLVTWEAVLGADHPAVRDGPSRAGRRNYLFPNGTEVVAVGMNNPGGLLSSEYDGGFGDELVQYTREDYELMSGRLRNGVNSGLPFARFIGATNPRNEWHWVNLAATEGLFKRYLSRHCHNPAWYDEETREWSEDGIRYLDRIRKGLTGARFEQYFMGRWASSTGMVFPMFDPAVHVIDGELDRDEGGRIWIRREPIEMIGGLVISRDIEIQWTMASIDWGYTNPCALQVWGVDGDQRTYLLAEIYRTEQTQDWWADRIVEFNKEFRLSRVVCDPAEPDRIRVFNDRLGTPGGRDTARIAEEANNSVLAGITHLQALLADLPTRGPMVFLLRNALRFGRDPQTDGIGRPCCLAEEFVQLYWDPNEEGKPIRERVDPRLPNHAVDAARYSAMWIWRKDLAPRPERPQIIPGSMGDVLGHRHKLEEIARRMRA